MVTRIIIYVLLDNGVYAPLFLSNVNPYFCKINIRDHETRCCNRYHIMTCYDAIEIYLDKCNQVPIIKSQKWGYRVSLTAF